MGNQLQNTFSDIIGQRSPVQKAIKLNWRLANEKPNTMAKTSESKIIGSSYLDSFIGFNGEYWFD